MAYESNMQSVPSQEQTKRTKTERIRSLFRRWSDTKLRQFVNLVFAPTALQPDTYCQQDLSELLDQIDDWRTDDINLLGSIAALYYQEQALTTSLATFCQVLKVIYPLEPCVQICQQVDWLTGLASSVSSTTVESLQLLMRDVKVSVDERAVRLARDVRALERHEVRRAMFQYQLHYTRHHTNRRLQQLAMALLALGSRFASDGGQVVQVMDDPLISPFHERSAVEYRPPHSVDQDSPLEYGAMGNAHQNHDFHGQNDFVHRQEKNCKEESKNKDHQDDAHHHSTDWTGDAVKNPSQTLAAEVNEPPRFEKDGRQLLDGRAGIVNAGFVDAASKGTVSVREGAVDVGSIAAISASATAVDVDSIGAISASAGTMDAGSAAAVSASHGTLDAGSLTAISASAGILDAGSVTAISASAGTMDAVCVSAVTVTGGSVSAVDVDCVSPLETESNNKSSCNNEEARDRETTSENRAALMGQATEVFAGDTAWGKQLKMDSLVSNGGDEHTNTWNAGSCTAGEDSETWEIAQDYEISDIFLEDSWLSSQM